MNNPEHHPKIENEQLLGGYTGKLLFLLSFGIMSNMAGRTVLSPLLPSIIENVGLTPGQAGFALTLMWGFTALTQFPGGQISDALTRKTVIVLSILCMIIGFSVLMSAQLYLQILLGAIIIGFGTGFFPPAAYAMISDLYNNHRGRAVGIYLSSFNFGGVAASILAIGALALGTWRFAFPPVLIVLLVVALLMHYWNQEPYILSKTDLEIVDTARGIASPGKLRLIIVAMGLFMIVWQGIINFLPTFLQTEKGWSGAAASQAFAGIFIISMVGNPIAGGIGDEFGYPKVASGAAVLTIIGLITLTIMNLNSLIILGIVVFAVGISGFMPVINTYILYVVPPDSTGGYVGGARTVFLLIGSVGSTYVGVLAEYTSYTISFLGLLPFIVTTLFVTLWLTISRSTVED